ncbi:hydrolase, partial [Salmonella enterica]|nr:hydrolase [Salmonella enterica]EKK8365699.1 hydrolase [Salmonella enterica]EKM5866476.1 hydrolase [Salmonella enterica]ELM2869952.1 hydrolase [Salmonella enterica]
MRLKLIVKSFALAGLLSSTALTPLFAQEAPKGATASTKQANDALYNQLPFSD